MTNVLARRGPDDSGVGVWETPQLRVGLGHRRLSILDLSEAGHQPMVFEEDGLAIAYNGEIYNFAEIRRELEGCGYTFRSRTDTEVVLRAYQRWGTECFSKFNGMWGLAIWDEKQRQLVLSRDRVGIKPVYYYWDGQRFVFGSEIKSIVNHPGVDVETDLSALQSYFWLGYVPAPLAILKNITKLLPGHYLVLKEGQLETKAFWSLPTAEAIRDQGFQGNLADAADRLQELLEDSVRLRMIADVPVGAFLSGGVDSSTIAALMAKIASPLKTYCVSFPTANEAPHAKAVADHIGSEHEEMSFDENDLRDGLTQMGAIYDEPLADPAGLPTALLSRAVRDRVAVVLTGDGGDELLLGYPIYQMARRLGQLYRLPSAVRQVLSMALQKAPHPRLRYLGNQICANDLIEMQMRRISPLRPGDVPQIVPGSGPQWTNRIAETLMAYEPLDWPVRTGLADVNVLLPDQMLVKVDRASMHHSLEVRVPLLDHRVVEFAASLPLHLKMAGGKGKLPLRAVVDRLIPREIMERPKQGFHVPLSRWFSGPLRDYVWDLVGPMARGSDPLTNSEAVREILERHGPDCDFSTPIFALLSYAQWKKSLECRWANSVSDGEKPETLPISGTG